LPKEGKEEYFYLLLLMMTLTQRTPSFQILFEAAILADYIVEPFSLRVLRKENYVLWNRLS
jgi:hypothetical protein